MRRRAGGAANLPLDRPAGGRDSERIGDLELVISRGGTGYLALYEYAALADRVVILALRHQREAGTLERGAT